MNESGFNAMLEEENLPANSEADEVLGAEALDKVANDTHEATQETLNRLGKQLEDLFKQSKDIKDIEYRRQALNTLITQTEAVLMRYQNASANPAYQNRKETLEKELLQAKAELASYEEDESGRPTPSDTRPMENVLRQFQHPEQN